MVGNVPQTISHCLCRLVALAHLPHLPFHYTTAAQVRICVRTIPVSDKVTPSSGRAVPCIFTTARLRINYGKF